MSLTRIGNDVFDWERLYAVHLNYGTRPPTLSLFIDLPDLPELSGEKDDGAKPSIVFNSNANTVEDFRKRLTGDPKFIVLDDWAVNPDRILSAKFDPKGKTLRIAFWFGSSTGRSRHLLIGPDADRLFQAISAPPAVPQP